MRRKRKTTWAYLDGKKLVDVVRDRKQKSCLLVSGTVGSVQDGGQTVLRH